MNPIITFKSTASKITPASIVSPIAKDAMAAIIKRAIKISANWDKNNIIGGVGFFSSSSFKPYLSCLLRTSLSLNPSGVVLYFCLAT